MTPARKPRIAALRTKSPRHMPDRDSLFTLQWPDGSIMGHKLTGATLFTTKGGAKLYLREARKDDPEYYAGARVVKAMVIVEELD